MCIPSIPPRRKRQTSTSPDGPDAGRKSSFGPGAARRVACPASSWRRGMRVVGVMQLSPLELGGGEEGGGDLRKARRLLGAGGESLEDGLAVGGQAAAEGDACQGGDCLGWGRGARSAGEGGQVHGSVLD